MPSESPLLFSRERCIVIAEAGINHNGDLDCALEMIDKAAEAGVDVIKFQTISSETDYNFAIPDPEITEAIIHSSLPKDSYSVLKNRCTEKNILFMSSAADVPAARFLNELGVCAHKVSSGNFSNYLLLDTLLEFNTPVILSTGLADFDEICETHRYLSFHAPITPIAFLYCVSQYPADLSEIDFCKMTKMIDTLDIPVGFSDHSTGIISSLVARCSGACIIEKHFTLDRNQIGPDHHFSLLPEDFRSLISNIRDIEKMQFSHDSSLNSQNTNPIQLTFPQT